MAGWVGGRGRGVALGQALVGFGIFFLGLDVLKGAFADAGDVLDLVAGSDSGVLRLLPYVGAGVILTVLMQSSSAALAVTLTAAAGGLLPLPAATAMVIGANVGTTSTAVFATIGATAPARRAAMAHVLFNVVAALGALVAFPLMLGTAVAVAAWFGADEQPATVLAVFHTLSKLLGVTLIWPLTGRMVTFLERRFQRRQADPAVLQFLDRTVAATPRLAIDALALELRRIGTLSHRMARAALSSEAPDSADLAAERSAIESLGESAISFTGLVTRGGDPWVDAALPDAVRVVQYYRAVAERAADLAQLPPPTAPPQELEGSLLALHRAADQALTAADPAALQDLDEAVIVRAAAEVERIYPHTKAELLRAGSRGLLSAAALVRALDRISMMRRMVDQACKAARYLAHLRPPHGHTGHVPPLPPGPPESESRRGLPADQLPIHDQR
jgi:phosphate:Na+ symporter